MTHLERAEQLLHQQYHCSQALFGAFADDLSLDIKTAFKISTCFGAGMRQGSLRLHHRIPSGSWDGSGIL